MAGFRTKQTARTALRLLAQEREALLSGHMAGLPVISEKLERCAQVLESVQDGGDAELRRLAAQIRITAAHNQTLAEAARRGLKSAARLHADALKGAVRLQTYTPGGRTQIIGAAARHGSDRRT